MIRPGNQVGFFVA